MNPHQNQDLKQHQQFPDHHQTSFRLPNYQNTNPGARTQAQFRFQADFSSLSQPQAQQQRYPIPTQDTFSTLQPSVQQQQQQQPQDPSRFESDSDAPTPTPESYQASINQPSFQFGSNQANQGPNYYTTFTHQKRPPRKQLEGFWSHNFIRGVEDIDMALEPTVPKHLNFITGNKNKLAEVQAILDGVIELRSQNVDLVEIQGTVDEVTTDKCRRAAEAVQGPVLVEDTCLCFRAMNDLPGPYIKWFMLALGPLKLHHMLDGFDDKFAQAVCTFAYCEGPGYEPVLFQGRTDGKLVASRGPTVFGWDSCFEYEGKTYAEMEKSEKNKISHRGKALDKLKEWLARRAS